MASIQHRWYMKPCHSCTTRRLGLSKAHQFYLGLYPVSGRPYEEKPLPQEIWDQYQCTCVRYRFREHVPGQDEVREDEQDRTKRVQAASLEHGQHKHETDEDRVNPRSGTEDSGRSARNNPDKHDNEQCRGTQQQHCCIPLGLPRQSAVMLYLGKITLDEEPDHPYMGKSEHAHLPQETVRSPEEVSRCRTQHGKNHLPRA